MKLLCACLTSSHIEYAVRCVKSFYDQVDHSIDFEVKVFVNTTSREYESIAKRTFVPSSLVITESNGLPGKGKNSVINWFLANEQYTHLMIVDGDDLLYPVAFNRIENILSRISVDVIGLQRTDALVRENRQVRNIQISYGFWLEGWFHKQVNHAGVMTKDVCQQWFDNKLNHLPTTPNRLMLINRHAASRSIRLWYSDTIQMCDDVTADWSAAALHFSGMAKYVLTSVTSIYVYDSTLDGVVERFYGSGDWAYERIRLRDDLMTYRKIIGDRGFDEIPFITVDDLYSRDDKRRYLKQRIIV